MESAVNQPVKTKRELALERVKAKHPDMDFSKDEAFQDQIIEDFVDGDDEIAKYREREQAFSDMFTADPRAAQFMVNWRNGEDPTIGLVRMFGTEIKDAIDDPEMMEQIAEANKEYVERVAKEREYEDMYKANIEETVNNMDAVQSEMGIAGDQIDAAMEFLQNIVRDGVLGKFTVESIKMAVKALTHDADVEQAAYEGEVKGRNTKIEEKLRKEKKGDGTVSLSGKNNNISTKPRGTSVFDLAREAK